MLDRAYFEFFLDADFVGQVVFGAGVNDPLHVSQHHCNLSNMFIITNLSADNYP